MAQEAVLKDPEIEACLEEISQARAHLTRTVQQFQERPALFDPLRLFGWVDRYPFGCVLGGVALGFLLAGPGRSADDPDRGDTLLGELSRSGLESLLPLLIRMLL